MMRSPVLLRLAVASTAAIMLSGCITLLPKTKPVDLYRFGEAGAAVFGDKVMRHYLPYDYPGAVQRFLEHFRPCAGLLMETEIWPNLVHACKSRGTPLYLVNARLSGKSFAGDSRVKI